ncbi:MAG: zinc ribbon domain-containing protein, partial [Duncaniella sp.]|nr:zinc ribbon domain-containing protein [Duncaniella sp.]
MKCYHCKSQIDDDSIYCDQCGQQIFICTDCHEPGKGEGKRCGKCGKPLVPASELSVAPHSEPANRPTLPTRLVSKELGITINLSEGLLLGRLEGPYATVLSGLKFLSARHASIRRDAAGWIIADEGSRNGTAVNGEWCFSPLHFSIGDT